MLPWRVRLWMLQYDRKREGKEARFAAAAAALAASHVSQPQPNSTYLTILAGKPLNPEHRIHPEADSLLQSYPYPRSSSLLVVKHISSATFWWKGRRNPELNLGTYSPLCSLTVYGATSAAWCFPTSACLMVESSTLCWQEWPVGPGGRRRKAYTACTTTDAGNTDCSGPTRN